METKKLIDRMIKQNRDHRSNWGELIDFLSSKADESRMNNLTDSKDAYLNTLDKITELLSK
jgi:hypothetical protein